MTSPLPTPLIQLIGPAGSGKTTLCQLFLDAFSNRSVLSVDASEDGFLALSYGVQASQTLGQVAAKLNREPVSREAIDWMLQDLPVSIPTESEGDILIWDKLPANLTPEAQALLTYGLPRLFQTYDVVVWDGDSPPSWVSANLHPLIVITAQDEAYCQSLKLSHAMVLLSKAELTDSLPPTAQAQVRSGNWQFLGKLPPKQMHQYFQECFHKLDLPFALKIADS